MKKKEKKDGIGDHFVGTNKMIERRITSEEKKALKKPDTLE